MPFLIILLVLELVGDARLICAISSSCLVVSIFVSDVIDTKNIDDYLHFDTVSAMSTFTYIINELTMPVKSNKCRYGRH